MHPTTKGSPVFECQNIYVSFSSAIGISITVRVKSTDPKGHRRKREEKAKFSDVDYDDDPTRNPFYELLKKMDREQREALNKNFILENKLKYSKAD